MVTRSFVPDFAYHLLDDRNVGHLCTFNPDGSPHVTPVWIDRDGDVPRFNTQRGRVKARNLERDPRLALSITNASDHYNWLSIVGRATIEIDRDEEHIHSLAEKYLGRPYPFLEMGMPRLTVRISPEKVMYGEVRPLPESLT